jgi:hypothetical protein
MTDLVLRTDNEHLLEIGYGWAEGSLDGAEKALASVLEVARQAEAEGLKCLQPLEVREAWLDFGREHIWAFYVCYERKPGEGQAYAGDAVIDDVAVLGRPRKPGTMEGWKTSA